MPDARHPVLVSSTAVLLLAAAPPLRADVSEAKLDDAPRQLEEVIVTARRRAEPLALVPISVSSFDADELRARGVKTFQDLLRLSPGLHMLEDQATGAKRVSIRGVASTAGASTTGIYIDDTPIQAVRLGYAASTSFPDLFDVERVEVLRGPQGTLFGSGSEGGTVRFILTPPDLQRSSVDVLSEVATLDHGSPSYEAGLAFGGPVVADRLAYRISLHYRRDGGWIDLVDGTYQILDPTGASHGQSVDFTRTSTLDQDVNWSENRLARASLKWTPTDTLAITPMLMHSVRRVNDAAGNVFDVSTSDAQARDYSRQGYRRGPAGTTYPFDVVDANGVLYTQMLTLNEMHAPDNAYGDDEFALGSLSVDWDLGAVEFVSNSSYFDRTGTQWYDSTKDYAFLVQEYFLESDRLTSKGIYAPLGWKGMVRNDDAQTNFTQELRLQSADAASRLTWVAGLFYSHLDQTAAQVAKENFLQLSPWIGFAPTAAGVGFYAVTGGPPFHDGCGAAGPCAAVQNFFGADMLPGAVSFRGEWHRTDEQFAAFAQADWSFTERWRGTLGVRVSRNTVDFDAAYLGPESNANAPFGGDPAGSGVGCPVAPAPCDYGTGALAPMYPASSDRFSATTTTPKFGLEFQATDATLVYATATKGFRPAGASLRVPFLCDADLVRLGYYDDSGAPLQPTTYDPDSVWSYELGTKNRLLGNRLTLNASLYDVKWTNIQLTVVLPECGASFVDNLANATAKGFDLDFDYQATDELRLQGAVGYNQATFDEDATSPNGAKVIYNGGSSIPNAGPPWSLSLSAEYTTTIASGQRVYVRADDTYSSEWRRYGPTDPGTASYDPRLRPRPAYNLLNLRFGARLSDFDVSVFVQNVTDAAPDVFLYPDGDSQDWHDISVRPRTYGLTVAWSL